MLSGDFGESFIAYLLSKEGVHVVRASMVGFDLLAIDKTGKIFPTNKLVGISVKARISKSHKKYVPTIPVGSSEILSSAEVWSAEPYLGIVLGSQDQKLATFLVPFKDLGKFKGRATRKDVIATSELYKGRSKYIVRLF